MKTVLAAFEHGCKDATNDIADGRLRLFWGIRSPWARFCEDLFQGRFGITIEPTSCIVDDELKSYREAYNSTITNHVNSLFGQGAVENTWEEVWQYRKRLYDAFVEKRGLKNSSYPTNNDSKSPPEQL